MPLPTIYKIHPSIGVMRVGNSESEFFLGPEVPGRPPEGDSSIGSTVPPFKDSSGKIKRQGARFRLWRYDDNGKGKYAPVEEKHLDSNDVEWIVWTVHLANKKAGFFKFDGLLGDVENGPTGTAPRRRNASVLNPKDLWLDPGPHRISGRDQKPVECRRTRTGLGQFWPKTPPVPAIDYLGELRTDAAGRLIVLGGRGVASSVPGAAAIREFANNDGWFDDVSDGPVNAFIKIKGHASAVKAIGAWVLCGPPCFAPYSQHAVTLWDLLCDLTVRELKIPANDARFDGPLKWLRDLNRELFGTAWGENTIKKYKPVFEQDIWPILKRALEVVYLYRPAQRVHRSLGAGGSISSFYQPLASPGSSTAGLRSAIFHRLHPPGIPGDGMPDRNMPKLLGDDPRDRWKVADRRRQTFTPLQFGLLEQWARGNFSASTTAPPPLPPATITPDGLDRAALENCAGGGFHPGMECGWQIRHPALYLEPFRIKEGAPSTYLADTGQVEAGHFSRQMALPWHADFRECRLGFMQRDDNGGDTDWGWWPVHRPHQLYATETEAIAGGPVMMGWARSTKAGKLIRWPSGGVEEPDIAEMLANWTKFGFVISKGDVMFETERPDDVP
jgi:hypothetical protein